MTDPDVCTHDETAPVDVRDHTTGGTHTVARICTGCLTQLHRGWGCASCAWEDPGYRTLCDPRIYPLPILTRPCKEHA